LQIDTFVPSYMFAFKIDRGFDRQKISRKSTKRFTVYFVFYQRKHYSVERRAS
jgi:hypothetical protein